MLGHALVTIDDALAVAPGIHQVRLIVPRHAAGPMCHAAGPMSMATPDSSPACGRMDSAGPAGVAWVTADAATIAQDTAAEMLVKLRAGKQWRPLNLESHCVGGCR